MAKELSGKNVTDALNERLRARAEALVKKNRVPKLAIVRCGEDASQISYEKGAGKRAELTGVSVESIVLPEETGKEELIAGIRELGDDPSVHGVLLLRPLPRHLRPFSREICNALPARKDVDCMTDLSNASVYVGTDIGYPPCTPQAVMELLDHYGIEVEGKNVTVIGRSLVVGKPAAMMLMNRNATVTVCHTKTVNLPAISRAADIIVTSAGERNFLTRDFVREGQIVIDVSVNWAPEKNDGKGGITGDAVYEEVEPVVAAITPVPGGIGAITTSVLMEHVIRAAESV